MLRIQKALVLAAQVPAVSAMRNDVLTTDARSLDIRHLAPHTRYHQALATAAETSADLSTSGEQFLENDDIVATLSISRNKKLRGRMEKQRTQCGTQLLSAPTGRLNNYLRRF